MWHYNIRCIKYLVVLKPPGERRPVSEMETFLWRRKHHVEVCSLTTMRHPKMPLMPVWIINQIHYIVCVVKLLIHSKTSMVQLLKIGNGLIISPTLSWACDYFSLMGFKRICCKGGPRLINEPWIRNQVGFLSVSLDYFKGEPQVTSGEFPK